MLSYCLYHCFYIFLQPGDIFTKFVQSHTHTDTHTHTHTHTHTDTLLPLSKLNMSYIRPTVLFLQQKQFKKIADSALHGCVMFCLQASDRARQGAGHRNSMEKMRNVVKYWEIYETSKGKLSQYELMHWFYLTSSKLPKMGLLANNLCWKCWTESGTFLHARWECKLVLGNQF